MVVQGDSCVPLKDLDPRAPDLHGKILYKNESLQLFLVRDSTGIKNDFYTLDWELCHTLSLPIHLNQHGKYISYFTASTTTGFSCLNIPLKSASIPWHITVDDIGITCIKSNLMGKIIIF